MSSPAVRASLPLLLLAACGDPPEADATAADASTGASASTADPTTSPTTGAVDPAAVTYYEDVRPVLARHCVACHQDAGVAPFALDSHEAAAPFAAMIAESAAARTMPPYPADNSGACNTYRHARWLADEDIALLQAWADDGAPAGDPATPPPDIPPLPQLDGDVRTAAMPVDYTPNAALADDYRCFIVDPLDAAGDLYVTGFDVRPGNPQVVHHVVVFAPRTDDAVAQAHALDDGEPGPGYTCFGTSQVIAAVTAAWAPGGGATHFPESIGIKLAAGRPLIVQVHYNTLAGDGADRTEVDLQVTATGVKPARFVGLIDSSLDLPPGEPEVVVSHESAVEAIGKIDAPVQLHGVFPHMHTIGRSLDITVDRGQGPECLMQVPRWDFHWQLIYFYEQTITLDPADLLAITCRYDTTSRTEPTVWGEGTMDEMCVAGMFVSDP
jgi:hypothetical protein